jgi:phospholipid/cholesterol/gamma-HCH transport system ATP-binding protein
VFRLRGIRKRHYNPLAPWVLDGIDLDIAPGETVGLCGPGASGKSLQPEEGDVHVDGVPLSSADVDPADKRRVQASVGMLFQNNALFDSLNNFDNVAFPLRQRDLQSGQQPDEARIAERVSEALRGVGLYDHRDKMPSQLSGGQRKRVALARAVVARPPIILYDEPTAGLDPVTTAKIDDLLRRERAATGATVILVSSDIPALREFAPRLLMLYRGRLRYDGPAHTVEESPDPAVRQFIRGDLTGPL